MVNDQINYGIIQADLDTQTIEQEWEEYTTNVNGDISLNEFIQILKQKFPDTIEELDTIDIGC